MTENRLHQDKKRYANGKMPKFQVYFRKCQDAKNPVLKLWYRVLFRRAADRNHIEIFSGNKIGGGLYIGHPFGITVNAKAVIGSNCNLHKGVTIGQENRGSRKGVPTIGNCVWIGINSTVVGNITIGDDVLIAPNSFVNCDVPSHSVVFGNPCTIRPREDATKDYINNRVELC